MDGCKSLTGKIASILIVTLIPFKAISNECVRPPGFPESLPCPVQAHETVLQEHRDRINRLERLATGYAKFEFSTTTLEPEEHGLATFPTPIPVLRVVAEADVFFDTDSDQVRDEALPIIYIIAESLKREPPDVSLFIAGHTDSTASDEYNLELGTRRAQSVAAALVRRGIYQASIFSVSFGEYAPISTNTSVRGRAINRRVEFLFSASPEAIVEVLQRQEVQLCGDNFGSSSDNCRRKLVFAPSRVELAPGQVQSVLETQTLRESIINDRNVKKVEMDRKLQEIETRIERREILFSKTRIEIHLGSE